MYALTERGSLWTIAACHGCVAGRTTEDGVTVTVAPGSFVETHPAWDGSEEGARTAVLAWAASL